MNRRLFLGAVFAVSTGAGCISRSDSTPPNEDVINYEALPSEAQNEFTAALEQNGVKECDISLLDIEAHIIKYQGDYYTYSVQSGSSGGSGECGKDFLNVEKTEEFS